VRVLSNALPEVKHIVVRAAADSFLCILYHYSDISIATSKLSRGINSVQEMVLLLPKRTFVHAADRDTYRANRYLPQPSIKRASAHEHPRDVDYCHPSDPLRVKTSRPDLASPRFTALARKLADDLKIYSNLAQVLQTTRVSAMPKRQCVFRRKISRKPLGKRTVGSSSAHVRLRRNTSSRTGLQGRSGHYPQTRRATLISVICLPARGVALYESSDMLPCATPPPATVSKQCCLSRQQGLDLLQTNNNLTQAET